MAKPPKKPKAEEVEVEPDAWERFQRTINKIVPPKPHKAKPAPKRKKAKRKDDS